MGSMTPHALLWQALLAAHPRHGGRHPTAWTRAEVLACLTSWAAEHGRPPTTGDLGPRHQLPGYETIARVCGSVEAVYTALGWPYRVYGAGSVGRTDQAPREEEGDGSWMSGTPVREAGDEVTEWWIDTEEL